MRLIFFLVALCVIFAGAVQWEMQTAATVSEFLFGNDVDTSECAIASGSGFVEIYQNGEFRRSAVNYPVNGTAALRDALIDCKSQTIIAPSSCQGCAGRYISFLVYEIFVSNDNGVSYNTVPDYGINSLSANRITGVDGGFALVGTIYKSGTDIELGNGLLVSYNLGETFSPIIIPGGDLAYFGAFPSAGMRA